MGIETSGFQTNYFFTLFTCQIQAADKIPLSSNTLLLRRRLLEGEHRKLRISSSNHKKQTLQFLGGLCPEDKNHTTVMQSDSLDQVHVQHLPF